MRKIPPVALVCTLLAVSVDLMAGEAAQVLQTLESTRQFGFGAGRAFRPLPQWHYVMPGSMLEMKQHLSERDIPGLLLLLQRGASLAPQETYNDRYQNAQAASWGLAALCAKSIAPTMAAIKANQLDASVLIDHNPFRLIESFSQVAGGCTGQDAELAKAASLELDRFVQARQTRRQQEREKQQAVEDETHNRINENGLKMLTPEKATLTQAQRVEVFRASVKSMGLDREPLTSEQRNMVRKMYENMVLQTGNRSSN